MSRPRVIITAGDPAGIGPEVVAAALLSPRVRRACEVSIVGDRRLFAAAGCRGVPLIDVPISGYARIRSGKVSSAGGEAAFRWVSAAVERMRAGAADALVTAPLSKEALHLAGHRYPGHTELLAELTGTRQVAMLMAAGPLMSVMATRHVPVADVGRYLTVPGIVSSVRLAEGFLRIRAGLAHPRVVVCALNPHAGEGGVLGAEEARVIAPAVRRLRRAGVNIAGPLPADTAWRRAKEGACDLIVTMYHDQTMIPLKLIAPERIVNITAGLPFVRTSPGHGTAFDIAGHRRADPRPMIEAILAAARFAVPPRG